MLGIWVLFTWRGFSLCVLGVLAHNHSMKQPEYIEGSKALENFERGMVALFKVPKRAIGTERKKGRKLATKRKSKRADKD